MVVTLCDCIFFNGQNDLHLQAVLHITQEYIYDKQILQTNNLISFWVRLQVA